MATSGRAAAFRPASLWPLRSIFYALIFGLADARRSCRTARRIDDRDRRALYAGVGVAGLLFGGNYLDYFVLSAIRCTGSTAASSGSRRALPMTVFGRDAEGLLYVRQPRQGG